MGLFTLLQKFQKKYTYTIIAIFLLITIFLGYQAKDIQFESDLSKEMPSDHIVFESREYIDNQFDGTESLIITIKIDDDIVDNPIEKITDYKVLQAVYSLDGNLRNSYSVSSTKNIALIFKAVQLTPFNQDLVDNILDEAKDIVDVFTSADKKSMIMLVTTNKLSTSKDIDNFVELLDDEINRANFPYGVKTEVMGTPVLKSDLMTTLQSDFFFTIVLAIVFIFLFLFIITKKVSKTVFIMLPLIFGLIWYAGIVVLLGMKLSMSTVATGAMILGLGVEYSIFIFNKFNMTYNESKSKSKERRIEESLHESVGITGKSIFGSAATTIFAFLSLNVSGIPIISNLGTISALGIFSILTISLIVSPTILVLEKRLVL